ncbi:MAG: spore germination protein GerW family protein [Solirubrobacterales bacterium]
MDIGKTLSDAQEAINARRVYGEPYERNGLTVIPAASVQGGGGGGGSEKEEGSDGGGGFGLSARPVGAYVIRDGEVSWRPSFDLNAAIFGWQVVALVAIFLSHRRRSRC